MSTPNLIIAAITVFVVAALLYYQSHGGEGFENPGDSYKGNEIPADLHRAPVVASVSQVPTSEQRPVAIPGAIAAPREAMATRTDLLELDNKIVTWLTGAGQRERERYGSLTPEQLQRRVILEARLADIRTQLGTGMITDSQRVVAQETLDLRQENAGWRQALPNLEQVSAFGKGTSPERFLTTDQYKEFRQLFEAGISQLQGHTQPDPLQRVRLQQLQVMRQELDVVERRFAPPPIRMAAAQLYLKQMLKSEQPLPTLFSMEPAQQEQEKAPTHAESPLDILSQLHDLQWSLQVEYDPAGQELKRAVASLLDRVRGSTMSRQELDGVRAELVELQALRAPGAGVPEATEMPVRYDPKDMIKRARTLCHQVREAFPHDADALGCPATQIDTQYEAETTVNTVCDRIRYSVPTVTAAQFNCPPRPL